MRLKKHIQKLDRLPGIQLGQGLDQGLFQLRIVQTGQLFRQRIEIGVFVERFLFAATVIAAPVAALIVRVHIVQGREIPLCDLCLQEQPSLLDAELAQLQIGLRRVISQDDIAFLYLLPLCHQDLLDGDCTADIYILGSLSGDDPFKSGTHAVFHDALPVVPHRNDLDGFAGGCRLQYRIADPCRSAQHSQGDQGRRGQFFPIHSSTSCERIPS